METTRQIATRQDIPFVESHIHALREAEGVGKAPFHKDKVHWSPEGHQIVAETLKGEILRFFK